MPKLITQTRLRKVLKKVNKPQTGWFDVFAGVVGKADGTIYTDNPGEIYVRDLLNGQPVVVRNVTSSLDLNTQVEVGKRVDQPNFLQIKSVRQTYNVPANGARTYYHAPQHYLTGGDPVFLDPKQILRMSALVSDPAAFTIQVYGGLARTQNGFAVIENQELDLSSYVPSVGAVYVGIETDDDGVLSVHVGDAFASAESGTAADLPVPERGQYALAFVLLYESMEALDNALIRLPATLENNPSNNVYTYQSLVYETHVADKSVNFPPVRIEGVLAATTGVYTWVAPEDGIVHGFLLFVDTAGASGNTIMDVNLNGATIFTISGNRPTFAYTDTDPVESAEPDVVDFVKGDVFTFDIDSAASGAAGLTLVPIANGYSDMAFVTDDDGNPVTEDEYVEVV